MLNSYDKERIADIAEIIRAEGYEIANFEGIQIDDKLQPKEACIGILCKRSMSINLKLLKCKIPLKASYIGNLWLNDEQSLDTYSTTWTLNIYGRENYTKLDETLVELHKKYYVRILKNIETETPQKEFYDN